MVRRDNFWRRLTGWLTAPRVAALLLGLFGVLVGAAGYLYHHCDCQYWPNLVAGWEQEFEALYANVAASLVTITITVITIDWLNERRAEQQLKEQLIREMGSEHHSVAMRAVRELRARGSIEDGSLKGVDLFEADLHGADLSDANLQGAILGSANLQGARFTNSNLQKAYMVAANLLAANMDRACLQGAKLGEADLTAAQLSWANLQDTDLSEQQLANLEQLRGTTMPDGSRYDGRYNLVFETFHLPLHSVNPADPEAVARFYDVPLEVYLAGQEWARENVPGLRQRTTRRLAEIIENAGVPQPLELPSSGSPAEAATNWRDYTLRRLREKFSPFRRK